MDERIQFFNPASHFEKWQNRLPHWEQFGATYFVTFRLYDALPVNLLKQWTFERDAWLSHHPEPWTAQVEHEYHKRFSGAQERWLDENHGSCLLREPAASALVAEALQFFDGERYSQHAWVVMPNHVHALFSVYKAWSLSKVLQTWKSVTAHRLIHLSKSSGETQPLWQKDYFDRLIRYADHFWNVAGYIRRNPVKGGLRAGEYHLWESDMLREM